MRSRESLIGSPYNLGSETQSSEPILFECPICGSNAYDTVYDTSNAMFGRSSVALYYECSQCSVMFTDPKKFTDVK